MSPASSMNMYGVSPMFRDPNRQGPKREHDPHRGLPAMMSEIQPKNGRASPFKMLSITSAALNVVR